MKALAPFLTVLIHFVSRSAATGSQNQLPTTELRKTYWAAKRRTTSPHQMIGRRECLMELGHPPMTRPQPSETMFRASPRPRFATTTPAPTIPPPLPPPPATPPPPYS